MRKSRKTDFRGYAAGFSAGREPGFNNSGIGESLKEKLLNQIKGSL
jgi:hypothetical protein